MNTGWYTLKDTSPIPYIADRYWEVAETDLMGIVEAWSTSESAQREADRRNLKDKRQ